MPLSRKFFHCAIALGILNCPAPFLHGQTQQAPTQGMMHLSMQDAFSFLAVSNATVEAQVVTTEAPDALQLIGHSDLSGELAKELPIGDYAVVINADGYDPIKALVPVREQDATGRLTITMHPSDMKKRFDHLSSLCRPGYGLVVGYIFDATTHQPSANASVSMEHTGFKTMSNTDGFFQILVPTSINSADGTIEPEKDAASVTISKYKTLHIKSIDLLSGDYSFLHIGLTPGEGTAIQQDNASPPSTDGRQLDIDTSPEPSDKLHDWLNQKAPKKSNKDAGPLAEINAVAQTALQQNISPGAGCPTSRF
jgi:hypothetical protein